MQATKASRRIKDALVSFDYERKQHTIVINLGAESTKASVFVDFEKEELKQNES